MDSEIDQADIGINLSPDNSDPVGDVLPASDSPLTERHLDLRRVHGERMRVTAREILCATSALLPDRSERLAVNLDREYPLIRELQCIHQARQPRKTEYD